MSVKKYSEYSYQATRKAKTNYSAEVILGLIVDYFKGGNVLDLGSGPGVWASQAKKLGAKNVQAVDGPRIRAELLEVEQGEYISHDLTTGPPLSPLLCEKYDLIIWLENIEHLPSLASLELLRWASERSEYILFSGAIPEQGGRGHINCQWQSYWASHFSLNGFEPYDIIRSKIWDNQDIPYWYKQNVILYGVRNSHKQSIIPIIPLKTTDLAEYRMHEYPLLDVVHPALWENQLGGIKNSVKQLLKAVKKGW